MSIVLWIIFAPLLIYLGVVGILALIGVLLQAEWALTVVAILILCFIVPPVIVLALIAMICLAFIGFLYKLAK